MPLSAATTSFWASVIVIVRHESLFHCQLLVSIKNGCHREISHCQIQLYKYHVNYSATYHFMMQKHEAEENILPPALLFQIRMKNSVTRKTSGLT